MTEKQNRIKLVTTDDVIFYDIGEVAKCSTLIKRITLNGLIHIKEITIFLPNIRSTVLKKVISWAHAKYSYRNNFVSDWEAKFMTVNLEIFPELFCAANYFQIDDLKNLLMKSNGQTNSWWS